MKSAMTDVIILGNKYVFANWQSGLLPYRGWVSANFKKNETGKSGAN